MLTSPKPVAGLQLTGSITSFKEGASYPEIISIKKLLSITGDLPGQRQFHSI